eukprot:726100_1
MMKSFAVLSLLFSFYDRFAAAQRCVNRCDSIPNCGDRAWCDADCPPDNSRFAANFQLTNFSRISLPGCNSTVTSSGPLPIDGSANPAVVPVEIMQPLSCNRFCVTGSVQDTESLFDVDLSGLYLQRPDTCAGGFVSVYNGPTLGTNFFTEEDIGMIDCPYSFTAEELLNGEALSLLVNFDSESNDVDEITGAVTIRCAECMVQVADPDNVPMGEADPVDVPMATPIPDDSDFVATIRLTLGWLVAIIVGVSSLLMFLLVWTISKWHRARKLNALRNRNSTSLVDIPR